MSPYDAYKLDTPPHYDLSPEKRAQLEREHWWRALWETVVDAMDDGNLVADQLTGSAYVTHEETGTDIGISCPIDEPERVAAALERGAAAARGYLGKGKS